MATKSIVETLRCSNQYVIRCCFSTLSCHHIYFSASRSEISGIFSWFRESDQAGCLPKYWSCDIHGCSYPCQREYLHCYIMSGLQLDL